MSTGTSGLNFNFEQLAEKLEGLRELRNDEKADVSDYIKRVDELIMSWKSFEELMTDEIEREAILEMALSSYNEETKSYDEELRRGAVDRLNDEIDRLRDQISYLVQIHNYDI